MNDKPSSYPLLFFLFVLYSQLGFAQNNSLTFQPVDKPVLKEYNLRKLCIDKKGKIWFATDKGVLSYDGNDIKVFEHRGGDSTSMPINSSGRLYLDDSDNLYVYTIPGVQYLNTKTGKVTTMQIRVRDEDKSKIAFPYAFSQPFIDNDASIWAGMYHVGFIHYSRGTKETTYYTLHDSASFQANTVYAIQRNLSNKNLLWLATDDGIYSFNKNTQQLTRNFQAANPKDSSAMDLAITNMDAGRDTIWFTAEGKGMGCYNIKKGVYAVFPFKNLETGKVTKLDISFLQRKNNEEYYLAEADKLPGVFNVKTHSYNFNSHAGNNLPQIQLRHFIKDSTGNIWSLIFYQLYLAKYQTSKLNTFNVPVSKSANMLENAFKNAVWDKKNKCYYVVFDSRNEVFVLDSNKQLYRRITIETGNYVAPKRPVVNLQIGTGTGPQLVDKVNEEPNIFDMGLDENGKLWLCGTSLWSYDSISKKIKTVKIKPNLHFETQKFQNLVFRNGYIYLQPSNPSCKAIYRININQLTCDSIPLPVNILNDSSGKNQSGKKMDVLQTDKKGKLAYLCYNATIFQLDLSTGKARKVITLDEQQKPFQHFFNMFWYLPDEMDNLWVATLSGIEIYEPQHLHVIKKISFEKDTYPIQMCSVEDKKIICVLYSNGLLLIDYEKNKQFKLGLSDGMITVFNSSVACVNNILFIGAIDYLQYMPLDAAINNQLSRRCYLSDIQLFNKPVITDSLPEFLHSLKLQHDQNFITLTFSCTEFEQPERLEYRYKLDGIDKDWVYANYLHRTISYNNLKPDNYIFHAAVKNPDGKWSDDSVSLIINITPAYWQTNWFKIFSFISVLIITWWLIIWRVKAVRKQEQSKSKHEKEMLELEAKALRAQMNPHFIFNCMNSIKSLIQQKDEDKAVSYLTTFSKLLRTILQNSDKREITLFDEIETSRLYTQLESMRFGKKFSYQFVIDETIDLKSIRVPALIMQPFIENAIWHGIVPKEEGGNITVTVKIAGNAICCVIDDDGIGREMSKQNKFKGEYSTHQSKGVHLTQTRLDLDNALNQRNAMVETTDKKDANGNSTGTTVTLTFTEY